MNPAWGIVGLLLFGAWSYFQITATPHGEAPPEEAITALLKQERKGRSLTEALARAVKHSAIAKESKPVTAVTASNPELYKNLPSEVESIAANSELTPEQKGESLLKVQESLPEKDLGARIDLLRLAQDETLVAHPERERLALRQVEKLAGQGDLTPQEVEMVRVGAELLKQANPDPGRKAELLSQLEGLFEDPQAQEALRQSLSASQ